MKKIISIILVGILLSCLGLFVYLENKDGVSNPVVQNAEADSFKPKVGELTFKGELPDLHDQSVQFGGEQNKLQLINFWASWCGPCELEAPDLQKIHEEYGDVLTLYGVNSTKTDRERQAREFVEQYGFTFDVLFDREGDYTKLYRVNTYPTSFLVDRDGVIRERINGVITYEAWEEIIKKWDS